MPADHPAPHILAINDTPAILTLLQEVLHEEGYRVTTRATGVPTPDEVATLQPDLVILDYLWGTADLGWGLVQQLRGDARTSAIPIILLTDAIRQLEPIHDQLLAMRVAVVVKPFDIDELVRTVARVLADDASRVADDHDT